MESEMSFNPESWNKNWYATADAEHRIEFRNWLRGILLNERMNISFIKADGTLRHLHCSLHHELAPAVYDNLKEDQSEDAQLARKPNLETLAVWDLEAKAWRSFRLDSVQDFSYGLGELHA
jgi:molybdopterin-guanine dinucleotide biosynthesis protein A